MEIEKEREDDNAKKKYFRDVGLLIVLCMSLYTYCNLKFNSVYYAQHIPHNEGTETYLVMLVKNVGWIYTPKIDNIIYDDGTNDIINTKSKSFLTKSLGNFLYDKDNMTVGFQKKQKNQVNESQIKREIKEDFFLNHEGSYKTFYQSSMVV